MFNPLTPSEMVTAIGLAARTAARGEGELDEFDRGQLMSAYSATRHLAIEIDRFARPSSRPVRGDRRRHRRRPRRRAPGSGRHGCGRRRTRAPPATRSASCSSSAASTSGWSTLRGEIRRSCARCATPRSRCLPRHRGGTRMTAGRRRGPPRRPRGRPRPAARLGEFAASDAVTDVQQLAGGWSRHTYVGDAAETAPGRGGSWSASGHPAALLDTDLAIEAALLPGRRGAGPDRRMYASRRRTRLAVRRPVHGDGARRGSAPNTYSRADQRWLADDWDGSRRSPRRSRAPGHDPFRRAHRTARCAADARVRRCRRPLARGLRARRLVRDPVVEEAFAWVSEREPQTAGRGSSTATTGSATRSSRRPDPGDPRLGARLPRRRPFDSATSRSRATAGKHCARAVR